MARKRMVIDCPSGMLALYDPESLTHRRILDRKWMRNAQAVSEDAAAKKLAVLPVPDKRIALSVGEETAAGAGEAVGRLQVTASSIYVGDLWDAPSKQWGRRRWNAWDWAFAAFLASLVPFGMWLAGFDKQLLIMLLLLGLLTVVASAAIAYIFFKGGSDFARRSGTPPKDHPDQVLELSPGSYAVYLAASEHGHLMTLVREP